MKYRIILIVFLTALLAGSCSDFLDVKPTGRLIPTEAAQLENLLNNANTYKFFFQDNNLGSALGFMGDNVEISQNEETYYYGVSSPNVDRYAAYTFYKPYIDPVTSVHLFWQYGIYLPVGIFNNVIDGIADLDAANRETDYAKGVVAQAKAARAFSYLTGTVIWGPMWDPSGDNGTRVLPYRITGSPSIANPDLSTTEELFESVKKDLDEALADIPDMVSSPVKAGKVAVHAMRAQFYMYKRDWPNMLAEADAAWRAAGNDPARVLYDLNDFAYKYVGTDPQDGTDYEVVLNLEYQPNIAEPFSDPKSRENIYYRECPSTSGAYPSQDWLALFDQDNDLRYKLFVLKNNGYKSGDHDDGIRLYNYRSSKMMMNGGITYPELLLMRAEAYARTDDLQSALNDLNTMRSYRYVKADGAPAGSTDHPDGAALLADKTRLIDEILNERRREQPSLSWKRAVDLKRYVYDAGMPWSKTSLTNSIGTKTFSIDLTDKMAFTLTIANATIDYNPHWGLTKYQGIWDPMNQ